MVSPWQKNAFKLLQHAVCIDVYTFDIAVLIALVNYSMVQTCDILRSRVTPWRVIVCDQPYYNINISQYSNVAIFSV